MSIRTSVVSQCLISLSVFCCAPSDLFAQKQREPGFSELEIILPSKSDNTPLKPGEIPRIEVDVETGIADIAPTIHFHRYFYSGDKTYQGPRIEGGPTTVVLRHPSTRKRMEIDVMLAPGTPEISYSRWSVTYIYPSHRTKILFSRVLPKRTVVKVIPGSGMRHGMTKGVKAFLGHSKDHLHQSRLKRSLKGALVQRVNIAKGAVGVVTATTSSIIDRSGRVVSMLPGVQILESVGKNSAAERAMEEVRQASLKKEETRERFVQTNR